MLGAEGCELRVFSDLRAEGVCQFRGAMGSGCREFMARLPGTLDAFASKCLFLHLKKNI